MVNKKKKQKDILDLDFSIDKPVFEAKVNPVLTESKTIKKGSKKAKEYSEKINDLIGV